MERWTCIKPRTDVFHLPVVNEYIATDFTIKEPQEFTTMYPEAIIDGEIGRLWFKKDTKFKVPKGWYSVIVLYLNIPSGLNSPVNG